jgi:membrane complex biogenesis BtpA family protein
MASMNPRSMFRDRLGAPRALVGVVHVGPLPGTPMAGMSLDAIVEQAIADARIYRDEGFTAIMVENMHDRPYLRGRVGPEIVAAMTVIAREVKRDVSLPLGLQILAGANREALAAAHASGADFVRVEGFVFAHVADEGLIQSCAGELLRYRKQIGAERVLVMADIKKKHSAHAITADVSIEETAHAAELFLADGLVVTGPATGLAASPEEVRAVADAVQLPVLVGSGITTDNLPRFGHATGFIVGSSVKRGGRWDQPLDPANVRAMVRACAALEPAVT